MKRTTHQLFSIVVNIMMPAFFFAQTHSVNFRELSTENQIHGYIFYHKNTPSAPILSIHECNFQILARKENIFYGEGK